MSRIRQNKWGAKILFALAGMAIFFFSYQLGNQYANRGQVELAATKLAAPVALTELDAIDKNGEPFTVDSFSPYWNLIIVGNHKLDGCKQLMTRYVLAWNRLAHIPALQKHTRIIFLPLRTDRLSSGELAAFVEFYNPDFTAISGNASSLEYLVNKLGLPGKAGSDQIYCDDHDSVVGLVNPQGYLVARFTGVTDPRTIARDLEHLTH